MINITKYKNRKLYSSNFSRYITLSELVGLIRNGNDVKITEDSSEKDITNEVLKSALSKTNFNYNELVTLLKK